MNYQDIIFFDFETTSINPHRAQPTQLAAVAIHGRKLEIQENVFNSYIQPIWDEEECARLDLDVVTDEVLEKTHIDKEELKKAPAIRSVWQQFQQYVNRYNPKKTKWGAPIRAGMNIDRYDNIIIDRICGGHFRSAKNQLDKMATGGIIPLEGGVKLPEPYGFGPWDNERQETTLFYPRDSVDLLRVLWMWTENLMEVKSLSMDAMREWLGLSTDRAHDAKQDVIDGATILIKFLKLHRHFAPKVKFKGSFANV